jgi:hypothetical protein
MIIYPSMPEFSDFLTPQNAEYAFSKLGEKLSAINQRRTDAQRAKRFEMISTLHSDQVVGRFLMRYYGIDYNDPDATLLHSRGNVYPVYTRPEWLIRRSVDDVLHRPLLNESFQYTNVDGFQGLLELYTNELLKTKRVAYDGDTYRVLEVRDHPQGYKLVCSRGRYFGFLGTCGIISDELIDSLIDHRIDAEDVSHDFILGAGRAARFKKVASSLSARSLFAPNLTGLLDFRRRDCKVGLNVMTVIDADGGPLCMLNRRSSNTAEYPNLHHVIPAGTFQPDGRGKLSDDQLTKAFSLRYKVLSELWEECFESKDSTNQDHVLYGRIDLATRCVGGDVNKRPIDELMKMMSNDEAYLFVTGFGIDLLTASPEISLLLVIKDKQFARRYEPHWRLNWEFREFDELKPVKPKCFYPLSDVEVIHKMMMPGHAVPDGAMAIAQGYRTLLQLVEEGLVDFKVPRWEK